MTDTIVSGFAIAAYGSLSAWIVYRCFKALNDAKKNSNCLDREEIEKMIGCSCYTGNEDEIRKAKDNAPEEKPKSNLSKLVDEELEKLANDNQERKSSEKNQASTNSRRNKRSRRIAKKKAKKADQRGTVRSNTNRTDNDVHNVLNPCNPVHQTLFDSDVDTRSSVSYEQSTPSPSYGSYTSSNEISSPSPSPSPDSGSSSCGGD